MPSLHHQLVLNKYVPDATRHKGFYKAISKFFCDCDGNSEPHKHDEFTKSQYGVVPDGFELKTITDEDGQTIRRCVVYEVQLNGCLSDRRIEAYASLTFGIDSYSEHDELELHIVGPSGQEFILPTDDLIDSYIDRVYQRRGPLAPVRQGSTLDRLRQKYGETK